MRTAKRVLQRLKPLRFLDVCAVAKATAYKDSAAPMQDVEEIGGAAKKEEKRACISFSVVVKYNTEVASVV